MANKILTDRVSVRVTAKQSDQSSQNKATGRTLEKALGGSGLTDAQAEAIGANIPDDQMAIDETGNLWVVEEQLIAAGKTMKANGAFDKEDTYTFGNIACIPITSCPRTYVPTSSETGYNVFRRVFQSGGDHSYGEAYLSILTSIYDPNNLMIGAIQYTVNDSLYIIFGLRDPSGDNVTIYNQYTIFEDNTFAVGSVNSRNRMTVYAGTGYQEVLPSNLYIPLTQVGVLQGSLSDYGNFHEEPGGTNSLINWDASDDSIKEQIDNLHEVWPDAYKNIDGSASSYVLAGAIEYNDPDIFGPPVG